MKRKQILIISFLLAIILLWAGYRTSLRYAQYLPLPLRTWLGQAHWQFQTVANNLLDAAYPATYWQGRLAKKLPAFNLMLSPADVQKLAADARQSVEQGYTNKQTASTKSVTLIFENQEYPAGISFHGGGANDHVFNKNDYNVKIKNNQTVSGYGSFNLFNPSVHDWLVPMLANRVAEKLNLYYNHQFPVLVKINHKTSGIYLLEEKVNQDFLDRRQLASARIIKLRDETRLPHRVNTVALNAHILSGLDWEIANVDPISADSEKTLYELNKFYSAIKAKEVDKIVEMIDVDYWARYDAYRELFANNHDTVGANLFLFYLPEDNKIYPILRNEGDLNRLSISGGTALKSYNNYDPHLAEQYDYPRLWLLLNRDSEFRRLKYQSLYQLANEFQGLNKDFDSIYDQYAPVFINDTSDEASAWQKKRLFKNFRQMLNDNMEIIKQELTFAQAAINVINESNQVIIEIIPDAVVPIKFDSFTLEFRDGSSREITEIINSQEIIAAFSDDYDLLPTAITYLVPVTRRVKSVSAAAKNLITGAAIDRIFSGIASN